MDLLELEKPPSVEPWRKNSQFDFHNGTSVPTSLLAHKNYMSSSYSHARLLEINSHTLFSKWFSESGKLVHRLFISISELADEGDAFLVVLIGKR